MNIHDFLHLTPEHIKSFRRAHGLSQQALAIQLGVGIATVGRWEHGTSPSGTAAAILHTVMTGSATGPQAAVMNPQRMVRALKELREDTAKSQQR